MGMGTGPTDSADDFTASDILSPQLWTRRNPRPVLGLDVTCTKIAVDFQSHDRSGRGCLHQAEPGSAARGHRHRRDLHRAHRRRASFIESITVSKSLFAQCRPEVLKGELLDGLPWLKAKLDHMRILEIRDTSNVRREQSAEGAAPQGAQRRFAAADRVRRAGQGVRIPRPVLRATARGLGRQPASAAQAHRHQLRLRAWSACASASTWPDLEERNELAMHTGNDGLWDFDAQTQPRLLLAALEGDARLRRGRLNNSPDWRQLVHPDDMPRVQAAIRDHVAGKIADLREHAPHAPPQRRVALGREPRQGARRRERAAAAPGRRRARHHRAQALRGGAVPREGERADHAAVHRRRRHHHRPAFAWSSTSIRWPRSSPAGGSRMRRAGRSTRSSAPSTRRPASRSRTR